ncbi:MAG: transglutaminase domain-containing protein [Deltaproteobacteria bacterium]|nr:transglutaminase domain-containing protein [Deltaproteobacteria bacterium]
MFLYARILFIVLYFLGSHSFSEACEYHTQKPQNYAFTYSVEIKPALEAGKTLSVWIPYPFEGKYQKVLKFNSKLPQNFKQPLKITAEPRYGNRMIYLEGKTSKESVELSFEYEVLRYPYFGCKDKNCDKYSKPYLYKAADKLVPFFPQIRTIAAQEAKAVKKPSEKIRAFYDYVVREMRYDKSGEGWGRGDAVWACTYKRGNCTDFHSLFIAMSRSEKIPARFEIGVSIPQDQASGEIPGYHCWAEAYAADQGWIPIDATEAKKTGKIDEYFGTLPANRIEFSRGRDLVLNPPQKGEPLNYFIYPYAEVEGAPYTDLNKKFSFQKLKSS